MTSYPIGIVIIATMALGQEGGTARPEKPDTKPPAESTVVHKLETVTWNPAVRELSWGVSVWDLNGTLEAPIAKHAYTVRLDSATMESNGETRGFDTEEAQKVRQVMDMISAYAVVSTVWWERGLGEKTECPKPDSKPDSKPNSKPESKPASVSIPGNVAAVRP